VNPAEYRRLFEAEETHWWFVGMRAITETLLEPFLEGRGGEAPLILDAGCGTGSNLEYLGRRGRALGVDLSENALAFCRARGVTVAGGSLLQLPFPDSVFDCVASFDVLYHRWIEDDAVAVLELCRVLRPGGILFLRLPALEMLRGAHDEAVHTRHRYTRKEVRALLDAAGLKTLRITYSNSLLLPLLALRRSVDRLTGSTDSDVAFLPRPLEWAFRNLLILEARLLKHISLPIGASIFAIARRRAGPAGYNAEMQETPVRGNGDSPSP
jgi:SAM-dependent methyltransferase